MNLYCMNNVPESMRIEKNKDNALRYMDTISCITPENEELFFNSLEETINANEAILYVKRTDIEKEYVYRKINKIKSNVQETTKIDALNLLDEVDNLICQQMASGLFECSNDKNEVFMVNEEQYARVKNRLSNNGIAYKKIQK